MRKKDRHELPSPIQPQLVLSLCARFLKKGTIVLEIAVHFLLKFYISGFVQKFILSVPERSEARLVTITVTKRDFIRDRTSAWCHTAIHCRARVLRPSHRRSPIGREVGMGHGVGV